MVIQYTQHMDTPHSGNQHKLILSIFYICKLFLIFFLKYPLKNLSLTKAKIGGRNIYKAYNGYSVINSRIFISTCWFYFHDLIDLFRTRLIVSSKFSKSSSSIWSIILHYFFLFIFFSFHSCYMS